MSEALELVRSLAVIPGCPSSASALATIAGDLEEICPDAGERELLVKRARRECGRWPGIAGLRDLLTDMRPTTHPERIPFPPVQKPSAPQSVVCARCQDVGWWPSGRNDQRTVQCPEPNCTAGRAADEAFGPRSWRSGDAASAEDFEKHRGKRQKRGDLTPVADIPVRREPVTEDDVRRLREQFADLVVRQIEMRERRPPGSPGEPGVA